MSVKRFHWLAALGWTMGLSGILSAQQPIVWRAAGTGAAKSTPIATLGRPVPGTTRLQEGKKQAALVSSPTREKSAAGSATIRAQAPETVPPPPGVGGTRPPAPPTADPGLGNMTPLMDAESGITTPISMDPPVALTSGGVGTAPPQPTVPPLTPHTSSGPPDEIPPPPTAPFPSGGELSPGILTDRPVTPNFWERCVDLVTFGDKGSTHGRCSFQSDTCFPGMISPITMPFYFEDPRALTEVRPIFMYQGIPDGNPFTNGGSAIFFGTQLRLAFTDRLSFVIHELGFLSLNPDTATPPFQNGTGFAELKMGPKYTFLRNTDTGTVAAAGLIFEIPAGSARVFQNTGALSLDPYATIGQTIGIGSGWGSVNLMGTTGYSFSINDKRAEFFYLNFHVDYNIANTNTIFPLFELNWIHYGNRPNSQDLGFEGADLINFGSSTRQGNDFLSLAGGLRVRLNEHIYAGVAAEFPVLAEKGLMDYRITFDVIFRY